MASLGLNGLLAEERMSKALDNTRTLGRLRDSVETRPLVKIKPGREILTSCAGTPRQGGFGAPLRATRTAPLVGFAIKTGYR